MTDASSLSASQIEEAASTATPLVQRHGRAATCLAAHSAHSAIERS